LANVAWVDEPTGRRAGAPDRANDIQLSAVALHAAFSSGDGMVTFQGRGIAYDTTDEIDRYFLEWGKVYLRRMWRQDLIGIDEKIGGHQFNEYLGVMNASTSAAFRTAKS
jgi:hypothetical protein